MMMYNITICIYILNKHETMIPENEGMICNEPYRPYAVLYVTLRIAHTCREHVNKHSDEWRQYYDDRAPQEADLPKPWHTRLHDFQRIMVLRCIRPDKVGHQLSWKRKSVQC